MPVTTRPPANGSRPRKRRRRPAKTGTEPRAAAEDAPASAREDAAPVAPPRSDDDSGLQRFGIDLDDGRIDPDAAKVVRRLARNGYEAYLVGGCVRDLLLGHSPKDFDVATNARPDDLRDLFRNSRVIGRRFRLVHVLFGRGKVIETATFRRAPPASSVEGEDLLIRNDNVFGEAHEDAQRRDFTINGLFYDVERKEVLDWVSGMPDIERRVVRTIREPVVRFLEDPVRILRAIKFSARLDLGIAPEVYDAIVQCRGALALAAKPRLFEEVLRLLRGGASHRSVWIAWETGVLDVLLPELSAYLADAPDGGSVVWRMLTEIDRDVRDRGTPADDIVLLTALLLEPMREACESSKDRVQAATAFLEDVIDRLNVPRRIADAMRRIVALMPRLEARRGGRFTRTSLYPLALAVVTLRERAVAAVTAERAALRAHRKATARRSETPPSGAEAESP